MKRILLIDDEPSFWVLMSEVHPAYEWHWASNLFTAKVQIKHQLPKFWDLILVDLIGVGIDREQDKIIDIIPCLENKDYNAVATSGSQYRSDKAQGLDFHLKSDMLQPIDHLFKESE